MFRNVDMVFTCRASSTPCGRRTSSGRRSTACKYHVHIPKHHQSHNQNIFLIFFFADFCAIILTESIAGNYFEWTAVPTYGRAQSAPCRVGGKPMVQLP